MAATITTAVEPVVAVPTILEQQSESIPTEQPSKTKGKWLQRISSSPTLAQLSRKRAISNPYSTRSTLSCVSLASTNPARTQESSASQSTTGGYLTAPTSMPTTPGLDTPFFDPEYRHIAIRRIENETMAGATVSSLPPDIKPQSTSRSVAIVKDYFSLPVAASRRQRRINFDFWNDMPHEIKLHVFAFLKPKELVRASIVCRNFHRICFDGQLWTRFDASEFYTDIPAESLAKIIVSAGPFVKDLNLRGCVQIEHYKRLEMVVKACKNLINATLEGCRDFQRSTLHNLLKTNERLANLNLTGLAAVTNGTCKIIAQSCPHLEMFNVSWCTHMDAHGIQVVIRGCPKLKDLRAGEIRGFDNLELAQEIFETNGLERLVLSGCADINDAALQTMIAGRDPEIDVLTDIPMVPSRRLRHLDLSRCNRLTSVGIKSLAHLVPYLEGLQLGGCVNLTDNALEDVLATTPLLTHLDLEELSQLTNTLLSESLAKAPCAPILQHLSISYCENLGDTGMLPVVRACTSLRSIDMDNTKVSDLVLAEAASMVRSRSSRTTNLQSRPRTGLRMIVYDCQNVTWTGIREVLSRNSEVKKPSDGQKEVTYPTEVISLKCFYGWQLTVDEHTKRVLRGDLPAAGRLERKWVEYMMANEEAGAGGAGLRRRRRRAREAQMMHADEEEGGGMAVGGVGRRRRARSNGCFVM